MKNHIFHIYYIALCRFRQATNKGIAATVFNTYKKQGKNIFKKVLTKNFFVI